MLGTFLEISIQTQDILASLDFYRRIGFEQAPVHDVWSHPYAVITDGRVYLGLHQYAFPSPALTFVQPDLRQQVAEFEALGIQFEFCKLGDENFNEAGFYDPDRQMVTLLEARTCSPMKTCVNALCGYFDEYRLPVRNLQTSGRFWEQLGLIISGSDSTNAQAIRLATGGLNLGLQESATPSQPQIVFLLTQPEALAEQLLQRDIPFTLTSAPEVTGVCLTAPEGTQMLIIGSD